MSNDKAFRHDISNNNSDAEAKNQYTTKLCFNNRLY
jgi:hypothetical protein